jgi:FkbM family methyltransferase
MSKRLPTIQSSLATLIGFGLEIETVVDVGVLSSTECLIANFPGAFHHLFEPLESCADAIERHYRSIRHVLNTVALSSDSGIAYQIGICRNGSGETTHSYISAVPCRIGGQFNGGPVTECKTVIKTTLDAHFAQGRDLIPPYLVKIDVDGHELPIIKGGRRVLSAADIVIVEATVSTLFDRGLALRALGLELIDVVNLCYYHETLSQVDLVFANVQLLRGMPDLRPWETKQFSSDAWVAHSRTLTKLSE